MPNLEWEVPHTLTSPLGSLDLNVIDAMTGYWYLVQPEGYKIVPAMRVTSDHVSQQSGSVMHRRFTSGLVATMAIHYMIAPTGEAPTATPACGADLRLMHEGLVVHLEALLNIDADPTTNQQLVWSPTGLGVDRKLSGIQTLAWPEPTWLNIGTAVTFSVECPLPYATDSLAPMTVTSGAPPVLATNDGTAPYYPIWRVRGPTSAFIITDFDDISGSTQIVYNGTTIPGGRHVDINTFEGTAFLDNGVDLIASIDASQTEFFPIQPGGTNVEISSANATVFTANAYA